MGFHLLLIISPTTIAVCSHSGEDRAVRQGVQRVEFTSLRQL